MGQFLPADHSKGDANTVGGYTAVHSRPPAFEGKDGASYSVEVMTDETGDAANPWGGYLLFVKWRTGDPVASGHLETPFLAFAKSETEARDLTGAMKLSDAVNELNALISHKSQETRPWWESMNDEDGE
jgi:hypothetical protein